MVPRKRELDCGCISGVLRVGWRDPEGLAHGWKTDGTEGGQWAIKTFRYPHACEVLSPFPLCLWPFYFISPQDTLWQNSPIGGPSCWRGREHRIGEERQKLSLFFIAPHSIMGLKSRNFLELLEYGKFKAFPALVYKTPKCPLWVLPLSFILFLFFKNFWLCWVFIAEWAFL